MGSSKPKQPTPQAKNCVHCAVLLAFTASYLSHIDNWEGLGTRKKHKLQDLCRPDRHYFCVGEALEAEHETKG